MLGVNPALGRLIDAGDDSAPGSQRVVVLSFEFWRSRFAESDAVLNATLMVNGEPLTIVGVAPAGFSGTTPSEQPAIFVPVTMAAALHTQWDDYETRKDYWLYLIARMRPGVSRDQARAAINGPYTAIINNIELPLQDEMGRRAREEFGRKRVVLSDGARGEMPDRRDLAPMFVMLFGITGIVVLSACANVANLLIVRGMGRAGEFAVRLSLGARPSQLVGQLMAESFALALLGGLVSPIVMKWTGDLLGGLLSNSGLENLQARIDATTVLFVVGMSIAAALVMGLLPALHSARVSVVSTLKTQRGAQPRSKLTGVFRSGLAAAQVALALALIAVAGLLVRSLVNISRIKLGLDPRQVTTFRISPELNGYTPERSKQLFERVEEGLGALPGVSSAGSSTIALLAGENESANLTVEGFEADADTDTDAFLSHIGPGFFRTLGIPLVRGREFTRNDREGSPKVAIVNQAFARKFNVGRDVVGKRMQLGRSSRPNLDIQIVGLVLDAKYSGVKGDVPPQFFLPFRQKEDVGRMTFYVRGNGDSARVLSVLPQVIRSLDPNLPVEALRTMAEQVRTRAAPDRLIGRLSGVLAALATLLAAIGLYGVIVYTVAQRTPEFGVRMALGAEPADIRRMVLREMGRIAAAGVTAGILTALLLGRLAAKLLFGLSGSDPAVLTAAAVATLTVALAAGVIPARRAAAIEPTRALRWE